jgi:hypothetical protein
MSIRIPVLLLAALVVTSGAARADEQQIAPGTGLQTSVVVNTGPDGICNTPAAPGDVQAADVGMGTRNRTEIRCGANKIVDSPAAGDDVQLVAVGAACKNANTAIVDTGANGIADTPLAGDDTYAPGMVLGLAPSNTPCVIAGGDGVAQTAAPLGDDNQVLAAGQAQANQDVVLCGPNLIADTTANNVNPLGDDVQAIAVGAACTPNQAVVDSGPNGIADTRAEGPDLTLSVVRPVKIVIPSGQSRATKTIKVTVSNVEFGAGAPASRTFKLTSTSGSCPGGTVTELDADAVTPGLQATASVALNGHLKASLKATAHVEDVTSFSTRIPFRCTFNVSVVALDTAPDEDDGANPENNTTTVDLEITDKNDL